ncbi:MAG: serine/threonine-protein kinase [Kofleriaceae bacterium]
MPAPSRSPMNVGDVVADTYKLEALIGRGGMGDVFAASHQRLPGKQVAIKFLHADASDAEIVARFRREAEIASRLGHPNIVTVLDFHSLPDGTPYLVLEYLVGQTLYDVLANGPLHVDRTLAIARQICSALAAAHRAGVVHRDLKPENIFLVPTEIEGRVGETAKILDFGISKIRGSQTVKTQDSALLGTPQYMAPEQATGQHDAVDGRTDIFALGAILYEMLCGQTAFSGASIPEVVFKVVYEPAPPLADRVVGVPPGVVAAIERAMAKRPDDRFATVGEFIVALTGVGLATLPPSNPVALENPQAASRKISSAEALAKTMGSGDHASAMLATALERPAPALTPPAAAPAPVVTAAPPARRSGPGKWLALGLASLGAAAAAFVVVRTPSQPSEPAAGDPPRQAQAPAASPTTPDARVATHADAPDVAATPDAAPPDAAPVAATPPDAATKPKPPKPPKPPAPDPAEEDLGTIGETLTKAWKAAEDGESVMAKKLANSVLDNAAAPPRARSLANQVIAYVACKADDRETAMRAARSARGLRPKVIKECAAHDIDLRWRR